MAKSLPEPMTKKSLPSTLSPKFEARRLWVKKQLAAREMKQDQLAYLAAIDTAQMSRMLSGIRKLEDHHVADLCKALQVAPRQFHEETLLLEHRLCMDLYLSDRQGFGPFPVLDSYLDYAALRTDLELLHEAELAKIVTNTDRMLADFRTRWPRLSEEDAPRAFHMLGDVLLQRGNHAEAAEAFLRAAHGYQSAMLDAQFQLTRAYERAARYLPDMDAQHYVWLSKAKDALSTCERWASNQDMDAKSLADHCKRHAEWRIEELGWEFEDWVASVAGTPQAVEVEDFLRLAIHHYQKTLRVQEKEGTSTASLLRDRAHCHINLGHCYWLLQESAQAVAQLQASLKLRLSVPQHFGRVAQEETEVAYLFKKLALAYLHGGQWPLAAWCAEVARLLYETLQGDMLGLDRQDAARVAAMILQQKTERDTWLIPLPERIKPYEGNRFYAIYDTFLPDTQSS